MWKKVALVYCVIVLLRHYWIKSITFADGFAVAAGFYVKHGSWLVYRCSLYCNIYTNSIVSNL